jgi:uncharacterized protein YecT (DUF1311 family)
MNTCASEEASRGGNELNEIYLLLLAKAASQPEAVAKIKAAERAWIAYRDAYMEAMHPAKDKQAEYGSICQLEANLLRAKLTHQQAASLKDLLKRFQRPTALASR